MFDWPFFKILPYEIGSFKGVKDVGLISGTYVTFLNYKDSNNRATTFLANINH